MFTLEVIIFIQFLIQRQRYAFHLTSQNLLGDFIAIAQVFEPGGGDEGEGDGGDAFNLDDDALVLLDALDDAFHAFEVAFGDADTLAGLGHEVQVFHVDVAVILHGGHTHEIGHLLLWHGEEGRVAVLGQLVGRVVEGFELAARHLQFGEPLLGGVDEDEAMNGGDEFFLNVPLLCFRVFVAHREEILNAFLVEVALEAKHTFITAIGDAHGIPEVLLSSVVGHERGSLPFWYGSGNWLFRTMRLIFVCTDFQRHLRFVHMVVLPFEDRKKSAPLTQRS